MGSCRKVEYESLPDNIKCWQEGFWEKLLKANPLETGCWLSAVCEEGNASWDVINCPSRWSLFLSLALCVDHHSNSETGTAMYYLGWPSFQNDREYHPSPALISNELSYPSPVDNNTLGTLLEIVYISKSLLDFWIIFLISAEPLTYCSSSCWMHSIQISARVDICRDRRNRQSQNFFADLFWQISSLIFATVRFLKCAS